ncbi:MAG TPA: CBS domain-containing protein [Thermoanaerobaculia bacterium]|nr:CBS domain-containing protein [Thermoanaerobaculia bacterium]
MTRRVETVSAVESVEAALSRMRQKRIRHLVVTRGKEVVGVVSTRDLKSLGSPLRSQAVEDIMVSPAITAAPEMTLRKAANLLRGRTIGCLPVMQDHELVGIVTTTDLLELVGRGVERPTTKGKRWVMKGRGPRRKSVVGHKGFAAH